MADVNVISAEVNSVIVRATKMNEARIRAQERFEAAKEALKAMGFNSLAEANEALAKLTEELRQLEETVTAKLKEVKDALDAIDNGTTGG